MATSGIAVTKPVLSASDGVRLTALADLILVRAAVNGGATRAELVRDLRAMTRPELAPAVWRVGADAEVGELVRSGLASEARGKIRATPTGFDHVRSVLAAAIDPKASWVDVRDGALTALALGLDGGDQRVLKALANPDQLRALIVQQAFGLGDGKALSLAKLRGLLAVRALERAFGNQIKSGLGSGGGLAAKASRLLAGQLSKIPRDYGSDGRLIAALAGEHLGTPNSEAETLRAQLLRRAFTERSEAKQVRSEAKQVRSEAKQVRSEAKQVRSEAPLVERGGETTGGAERAARPAVSPAAAAAKVVANDRGDKTSRPLPSARPDLPGFIRHVQAAAARRAEGWPGNRKAFICHVWQEINAVHPGWALSEIEFKGMLAEAHRTGGLVLANADLKDKKHIQEFELSAIQYKNTVWHFVRVEEA